MTTPTTRDEFFAAMRENRDRPKGRATAAIAEELVDAAEGFGDPEVTVSALVELMQSYYGSGEEVKFPVTFARLLQLWDENPQWFDDREAHYLFWYFKWVTSGLLSTPDVPLASIRGWIAEMRRRYQEAGHDLQPVYAQQYHLARQSGEGEELAYELWATRGRSRLSDCAACEARQRAGFHFRRGDDERGLAELQPTFDGGRTCDDEPHSSQAVALLPLLRLGRHDEARAAHLAGYRKVRGQEAQLVTVGRHLEFCALTGNEARGLELLAQNRAAFGFTGTPSGRLDFLTAVEVLLARLVETGHGALPCAGPLGRDWTVTELRDEVARQADELAARFDARNGTGQAAAERRAQLARRPLVAQLNLGVQVAAAVRPADDLSTSAASKGSAPTAAPAADLPEDFDELVAEARLLDRTGAPRGKALWDEILRRAETADPAELDDLLRGEIASELAQRAARRDDWDDCAAQLAEAVRHYAKADLPARRIAAESRVAWCAAVREDDGAADAAESAWPVLDDLLARMEALRPTGPGTADEQHEVLRRRLVVRHSRVFIARHAMHHSSDEEQQARWGEAFTTETRALIDEGLAGGIWVQPSVAYEMLAEYQAGRGAAAEGEANVRRAIEIFEQQGWAWRMPRARLVLALTLSGQKRHTEAMAELEKGLAEAPADLDPDQLTPLHRMLGELALRTRQYHTAVRAFSEAAARLDREGEALGARETRLLLGRTLCAQGSPADGVAVLESLLDPVEPGAPEPADGGATDGTPSATEQLTAQIRADLANALLSLDEPRDAAAQFLLLADAAGRWPDKGLLTSAAAGAAGALAQAGNWDGARAALRRALESHQEAPALPDVTDALRTVALELVDADDPATAEEAYGYLDQADRLREDFPEIAGAQFRSVEADVAQTLDTRGRVLATAGRSEEALAAFEQAAAAYERAGGGWPTSPPRFEAVRMAAVVEFRALDRPDAARARLDRAIAEATAADLPNAVASLRRMRDSLR